MILYHGSNVAVREPRLLPNQRNLDFGRGFYTTSDFAQASAWARRTARIRGSGAACVSCYEIADDMAERLRILRFDAPDRAWLDYVAANRRGTATDDEWDVVVGPVANDQTFPTIVLYLDGYLDAENTIRRLLPQKLKDQYTFKTVTALSQLRFVEAKTL